MRTIVGPLAQVKASGGVRSFEDAIKMVQAGASRIGTSYSLSCVLEHEVSFLAEAALFYLPTSCTGLMILCRCQRRRGYRRRREGGYWCCRPELQLPSHYHWCCWEHSHRRWRISRRAREAGSWGILMYFHFICRNIIITHC